MTNRTLAAVLTITLCMALAMLSPAQDAARLGQPNRRQGSAFDVRKSDDLPAAVLSQASWQRVDQAVERALAWLAAEQRPDGSFPTLDLGQPAVTSFCVLAFMAHGHVPGQGPYGPQLDRAVDYILSCQKPNGLVTLVGPDGPRVSRNVSHEIGTAASYNHSISSLALSEIYGMSGPERAMRIQAAIERSIAVSLEMQRWPKDVDIDRGGWRYIEAFNEVDSDLSVTGWYLMGLRSARNAGFAVGKQPIDDAVEFVRRVFDERTGTFGYRIIHRQRRAHLDTRGIGMAGAGILALGHAGFHNSREAQSSGDWLLQQSFDIYNASGTVSTHDRYHYSMFTCCQGMYQLGGRHWRQFFPRAVRVLLENQRPNGAWDAESHFSDAAFGNSYTTALVVLSLGAPNQLLPIFQR